MDAVTRPSRMSLFKATDAFAAEAYRIAGALAGGEGGGLAAEIRRTALRSGGAIVAASVSVPDSPEERRELERARAALIEGRYYLHLARRFGLLDRRRYRTLTVRQDAALREVGQVLEAGSATLERSRSG